MDRSAAMPPRVDLEGLRVRLGTLTRRAERAARALDFEQARELYDAAYVLGGAAGAADYAAEGLGGLGFVAHLNGEPVEAETFYTQALDLIPDEGRRALIEARLAFARYDRGDLDAADQVLARLVEQAPTEALRARAIGYRGNVARASGALEHALALYEQAAHLSKAAEDTMFAATFAMDRAIALLLRGDAVALRTGLVELETLRRDPLVASDRQLGTLVPHYAAIARAKLGLPLVPLDAGDHPLAPYLARARELARTPTSEGHRELVDTIPLNAHARVTLALVSSPRILTGKESSLGLVVAQSGSFFRLGAEEIVSFVQRPQLARLLAALVRERVTRPGVPVDADRLFDLAWPGERVLATARKNRLHVALATLRKLGLRSVIESGPGGYRIARDVDVVVVD